MHSHFAILSIGVLSPENQFRGHKNRACIHGTQALPPEKGRTKARVPICPISQNEIKAIFVSSALNAYQASNIYFFRKQKRRTPTRQSPPIGWNPSCRRPPANTNRDGYSTSGSACDLQRLYISPVSARPFCPQTA